MRAYHVDIVAIASSADGKWIDNLLSHHTISGVERERQGVTRRVSLAGILHIVLIRQLMVRLGVRTATAVALAAQALREGGGTVIVAPGVSLVVDRESLSREVESRVSEAVESVVRARRGRPPSKRPPDIAGLP